MANTTPLTLVYSTFTFEGVHYWSEAPDEVSYLRNPHRHIFHVKACKQVNHDNRDVEFIMLGHRLKKWVLNQYPRFSNEKWDETINMAQTSCEMVARQLTDIFELYSCEVSEDNENGAIIIRQ